MSTKPKSAVSGAPAKGSVATTRVSKTSSRGAVKSNADAASPLQSSRLSVDRSPRSVPSKPAVDRRSPKLTTPPEKKAARVSIPSEVQPELRLAKEELKKAEEKLVLVQNEKEKALDELKETRRLAEEAHEKLREALITQKRAEENSEIEKFRAVEMEQAGIEAAQRNEEERQKELETVRDQHAADVAALQSATQEIQKVKEELAQISHAKDQTLQNVEDATKLAEAHARKVEALSAELAHMKSVLDSRVEMEASEKDKFVSELKSEIVSLNQQLKKAQMLEENLAEKEAIIEQLNVDLEAAKMAESYARNLVDELQEKVEELSSQAEQAKRLERSASESLESVIKQLEGSNDSLHDAESQIGSLKEKVVMLEISIDRQKRDLEESDILLELAKEEASEMAKKVESLRSELETLKEEKSHSLNNEKLAAENVQNLLEEKNKLINELGNSRDEEEKSKRALESLASALHEVSSEARDAKEKLLSFQVEHENYESQIEDLKLILKGTNEKYESMLGDARKEIEALTNSVEQSKHDHQNSRAEWEQRELHSMNSIKKSEEEKSSVESEINRLVNLLKMAEEEACATREEEERWKNSFKEAESEAIYLKEVLGEAKAESMRLKEGLMDKENELQNILQENDELRKREASSLKKIEDLSKLLEEVPAKKHEEENGELTDSEKDYDMLPKVVEFYEQNGTGEVKPKAENQSQETELPAPAKETPHEVHDVINDEFVQTASKKENWNGEVKENELEKGSDDATEVDLKMWDNCNIEEKDYSPEGEGETEQESFEDEVEHKAEGTDNHEQANGHSTENPDNGGSSPTKQNGLKKKKKPLLHKFGSLLKKKGTTNQK
ncbi:WEB family protein At3g02930, chloroplastic-like [Salvia hispanica]|uniref:WEB family protein At3g02930, chloroplastic-like n=1 Tax=Salvia hispanica TaxID=49212 RepID=UPI002008F191|nr:WEB family protein At3g02930, chloroplastic-like [Salvia hispanica]